MEDGALAARSNVLIEAILEPPFDADASDRYTDHDAQTEKTNGAMATPKCMTAIRFTVVLLVVCLLAT